MNILFIMPLALPAYLFQLAALTAFLKSKGHFVRYEELVIDGIVKDHHLEAVRRAIAEFKPDLVGFSSYEMSFAWIKDIADYIKHISPAMPIIVGGYYPTLSPDEVLRHPSIDIICRGEGEYPLEELLNAIKRREMRRDILNLWFKEGAVFVKNPLRPLIANLDELPFVDRELFTSENRKNGALEIMASRGCSFECTNCSNPGFKEIYFEKGSYVRYRSVDNVLREIEYWMKKENFKSVQFEDDMFTLNRKWVMEFCREYKERIKLPFLCNLRPEAATKEILPLLKAAGCVHVSIGVEAGDSYIRQNVLGRNIREETLIRAFRNARIYGLKTKSYNMVGLPYETAGSLWKTVWLNFRMSPDAVQTSVYYPFKGTPLGDECYRNGWVDEQRKKNLKLYANDSILNLPTVPRGLIRIMKWLNSATALRSGNISLIRDAFKMLYNRLFIHFGM